MAGNAWTARRKVYRRPPVCKSEPRPEDDRVWPNQLSFQPFWFLSNGMERSDYTRGTMIMLQVDRTNAYTLIFADDFGMPCDAEITLGALAVQSYVVMRIRGGFFNGYIGNGPCPGWDTTIMWSSGPFDLNWNLSVDIPTGNLFVP